MNNNDIINYKKYQSLWGQLNKETKEHSLRVAELCMDLAPRLDLNPKTAYKMGYLHDIGKIYLPARILKKNCKLTPIERDIVDLHSYIGYSLLKEIKEPTLICLSVLYHHGFDKPMMRRISEVPGDTQAFTYFSLLYAADIYDARTHQRHYQNLASEKVIFEDLSKDWLCTKPVLNAIKEHSKKKK